MNKDINYKYLVKTNGKTIIYMGVSQINLISNNLIKNGMKKNTKVFIVTNSSRKNQKTYETTLIDTSKFMKKHNVNSIYHNYKLNLYKIFFQYIFVKFLYFLQSLRVKFLHLCGKIFRYCGLFSSRTKVALSNLENSIKKYQSMKSRN